MSAIAIAAGFVLGYSVCWLDILGRASSLADRVWTAFIHWTGRVADHTLVGPQQVVLWGFVVPVMFFNFAVLRYGRGMKSFRMFLEQVERFRHGRRAA